MLTDLQRSDLIREHEALAAWFARKYESRGLELEDALQDARIAVWQAALEFDAGREGATTFSIFARRFIVRALQKSLVKARSHGFVATGDAIPKRTALLEDMAPESPSDPTLENAIHVAISGLSERSKAILVRRYGLDGDPPWSVIECAFQFGIPVGTLKKVLAVAREEVGSELRDAGWDPSRWCASGQFFKRITNSQ